MNFISKILKTLKEPHLRKMSKLKEQYQELDELSQVAVNLGEAAAYKSLQAEMREVFFDYLTAVVVDSIYSLVPHVLIIWLISLWLPNIHIPIVNWQVNIFGFYMLCYFAFTIGQLLTKACRFKISKLPTLWFARTQETK